jgi:hypothetical protein
MNQLTLPTLTASVWCPSEIREACTRLLQDNPGMALDLGCDRYAVLDDNGAPVWVTTDSPEDGFHLTSAVDFSAIGADPWFPDPRRWDSQLGSSEANCFVLRPHFVPVRTTAQALEDLLCEAVHHPESSDMTVAEHASMVERARAALHWSKDGDHTSSAPSAPTTSAWVKVTDCRPPYDENTRVVVVTPHDDWDGKRFHHLKATDFYPSDEMLSEDEEIAAAASHWMAEPWPLAAPQ